ncbi:hypothetical protein GBN23_01420 [Plesiomonas shigelloides]|uniref:B-band O-antigen polymerase n=1 Tax=Plesiomonas shigelloides TaxID=703 RepID=A0A4D6U7S6_PLESH|nr:O-antigen polymerase [Plesiomonas shigelloides]KAB7684928.1 hypothetical protein GBN23_01420 [Plesiomonas shigelloides]QCH03264.1 B-band O-antigen polymerase [Plesiomonas shigelloides]
MIISKRGKVITSLILIFFGVVYLYVFLLQPENSYFGYKKISFDVRYFLWVFIFGGLTLFYVPKEYDRPSSFFVLLQILLCVMPFVILPVIYGGDVWDWHGVLTYFVVFSPIVLVTLASRIKINKIPKIVLNLNSNSIFIIVLIFCLSVIVIAFSNAPTSAGFSYATSYVRRLEGRDCYPAGSFIAYSCSIVMNGLAPLLAFWAGCYSERFKFVISIIIWLSFYYLVGVKFPLFMIVLSYFFGRFCLRGESFRIINLLMISLLALVFFSLIESTFFEYSYIADYLLRRPFTIPPFIISAFQHFISYAYNHNDWFLLSGYTGVGDVTFYVGEHFLGHAGMNANTNAFLVALTSGGVIKYVVTCLIVSVYFKVVDEVYLKYKKQSMLFCGFIYSLLLMEQSATTIFLSSGIMFVFILSLITSENRGTYFDN